MNKRRRLIGLVASLAVASVAVVAIGLSTLTGTAEAVATVYTVSRTLGPYNGAAPFDTPGAVPDGEAPSLMCNSERDALLGGSATINRTTRYGTTEKNVLNLDRIGAFWDTESGPGPGRIRWGTWIRSTGRPGWNSVTLTIQCLIRTTS